MIFHLFLAFILLPLTVIYFFIGAFSKKDIFGKTLKFIWGGILSLLLASSILQSFTYNNGVQKKYIYGEYIIDRSKFSGSQADWQYENFRFEITKDDQLIFHQITGNKTDTVKVEFLKSTSDRIRIKRNPNTHHIIEAEPTLYRQKYSFYYVFKSPKFGNVFFTKGKWKSI